MAVEVTVYSHMLCRDYNVLILAPVLGNKIVKMVILTYFCLYQTYDPNTQLSQTQALLLYCIIAEAILLRQPLASLFTFHIH